MPADNLPPDEPLDRRVTTGLAKIGIALKQQAWVEAGGRGLTPTQGQALALLRASPQGLRLGALAGQLGVTAATASDSVAAMHRKGLVAKEPTAGDGRGVVVRLTPAGSREAAAAAAWPDFLLEAVGELSAVEQAAFLRGLVAMIRALQEKGRIPVARMCVSCTFFRPFRHDDPVRPHHCAFVDAPFGDGELRLDCPDHRTAPPDQAARAWQAFRAPAEAAVPPPATLQSPLAPTHPRRTP
jgi:DNA-binding MarR family transcriptional regulator